MPRAEITIATGPGELDSRFTVVVEADWPNIPDQWYRDVANFFADPARIPEPGWPASTRVVGIDVVGPRPVALVAPNEVADDAVA